MENFVPRVTTALADHLELTSVLQRPTTLLWALVAKLNAVCALKTLTIVGGDKPVAVHVVSLPPQQKAPIAAHVKASLELSLKLMYLVVAEVVTITKTPLVIA